MKPGVYIETEEEITLVADLDEAVSDPSEFLHEILTQVCDLAVDAMASPDDNDRVLIVRIIQ